MINPISKETKQQSEKNRKRLMKVQYKTEYAGT